MPRLRHHRDRRGRPPRWRHARRGRAQRGLRDPPGFVLLRRHGRPLRRLGLPDDAAQAVLQRPGRPPLAVSTLKCRGQGGLHLALGVFVVLAGLAPSSGRRYEEFGPVDCAALSEQGLRLPRVLLLLAGRRTGRVAPVDKVHGGRHLLLCLLGMPRGLRHLRLSQLRDSLCRSESNQCIGMCACCRGEVDFKVPTRVPLATRGRGCVRGLADLHLAVGLLAPVLEALLNRRLRSWEHDAFHGVGHRGPSERPR
mmetsp:Transcript_117805/g.333978  ORF Transcript_117805/g.333978 Transcript_117805/m.333978 type:complete len:253 (-) Transcript_117805:177-935(-)